jgi:hypothetical protein
MEEWRYSSIILDLAIRWRWVFTFRPLPFYTYGNHPLYSLDRRICRPQSQSGHCGEEKKFCPCWKLNPSPWPVTIPTELPEAGALLEL